MSGLFDPERAPQGWLNQLILPTRDFILVIDPHCLEDLLKPRLRGALRLIADLMGLTPPVKISLILPEYLATGPQRNLAGREEPVGSNRWNLASRTDEAQRAPTETLIEASNRKVAGANSAAVYMPSRHRRPAWTEGEVVGP